MKKYLLIAIILPFYVFSQNKSAYVSDISLINKSEKWCWSINQDSQGNMLFGVERGIMLYDGINQQLIKTPSIPLAIVPGKNNKIWICGNNYAGILEKSVSFGYTYSDLKQSSQGEFNKIILLNDTAYVVSDNEVLRFKESTNEILDPVSSSELKIDETIEFNGNLFFLIDYFLHTIVDNKFIEVENIDFPVDDFSYALSVSENNLVLGTTENTFYTFNGKTFKTHESKSDFFDNNVVTGANLLSDSTIILSSLAGGIAIFDYTKNKIVSHYGYFNGLPDDEIRTSFIDKDKGIWVSHEFGISRIDISQGIESLNSYPGLKGNPVAITNFNNNLYVATNDGLFILDEIKDYNEFTVKVNIPVSITVDVPEDKGYKTETKEKYRNERKGFLKRKSRKNTEKDIQNELAESTKKQSTKTKTINKTRTVKKRSLKSISHYFTLVENMKGKYTQMIEFKNHLLVAGNNGLFAVKEKTSIAVLKNLYIENIYISNSGNEAFCATNNGLYRVYLENSKWEIDHFAQTTDLFINSVVQENNINWIITTEDIVLRVKLKYNKLEIINETQMPAIPGQTFIAKNINDSIYIYTSSKIYHYNTKGELSEISELNVDNYLVNNQNKIFWLFNNGEWIAYSNSEISYSSIIKRLKLFGGIRYIDIKNDLNTHIITDQGQLFKLTNISANENTDFESRVIEVKSENNSIEPDAKIKLGAKNNLSIRLSAPFYLQQNGVVFSYLIEGINSEWSEWTKNSELNLGYIPPGNYKLKYKAKNSIGYETSIKEIAINVPKPFTQTLLFYSILLFAFVSIAYVFFKLRLQKLQKDKEILEQKVKDRTATIEEQKSHIEKQHDEITGSIRYAKRIQSAMLPHDEIIEAMLPNHFILFNPRDIVSGDFYFFKPVGNNIAFVAADCTGHGVPGGFMSMLGMSFLSEITSQLPTPKASEIIDHLRDKIKLTLGQEEADSTQKDGMDLSICVIDIDNKQIQFAGAFNPLIMIRNGELEVIKADRQPVAVYIRETVFTNHVIDVKPGDSFYMFSDGFPDQIGGPKQRKFMSKNFKNLILENHKLPMPEQKVLLQKALDEWKGNSMQVDDILVVGFSL